MLTPIRFFSRLTPLLFVLANAGAQQTLSVRDAVEFALRNSPVLMMAEHRVGFSEGIVQQSRLLRSPRFLLQTENLRTSNFDFGNDTDTYALLSQSLELPGKRASRIAVAESGYRKEQFQRDVVRRELVFHVKRAYWRALAAERTRELLNETLDGMQAMVNYHAARVSEGAMAEADLLRVKLERERLEIDSTAATLEAERARIELFREMGRTDYAPLKLSDDLELAGIPEFTPNLDFAMEHRQEVLQARATLEQALANEQLERATARPDLDFIGGYKRTAGENTAVLGLSLDIPIFNRNQGNIKASTAAVHEAEAALAATRAAVMAEVQAGEADFTARHKQVTGTLRLIREHAIETSRIAQAAYQEGGIDLIRLIDAERIRIESQLLYFRALAEYQQSYANLENAMGVTQ
jgi:outer membrane protein, heavy metal efflux system